MARVEHTVVVNRPVHEVFAYLADLRNLPEWQAGVEEARFDGRPVPGARFTEVRRILGRRVESTLEITAYEPDREFSLRVVSGPVPFDVRHVFEPVEGGTKIHFVGQGEPGRFFQLAEALVVRTVQRQAETDLATLKELLEARA